MSKVECTYREAIQEMYGSLDDVYDVVGNMRDYSDQQGKATWNELRGLLRTAADKLRRLDNSLSDEMARSKVHPSLLRKYLIKHCQDND